MPMKIVRALAIVAALMPPAVLAGQAEGRRIFQQKCAVCHLPIVSSGQQPYARPLSRAVVERSEERARQTIANGVAQQMPGFRHTLRPAQIDQLIEYLKTVSPAGAGPARSNAR
jgi:mono/diheme cytochrome c family protein